MYITHVQDDNNTLEVRLDVKKKKNNKINKPILRAATVKRRYIQLI
jgi:hypothetical protein